MKKSTKHDWNRSLHTLLAVYPALFGALTFSKVCETPKLLAVFFLLLVIGTFLGIVFSDD